MFRRHGLLVAVLLTTLGCSGAYDKKLPTGSLKDWTPDDSFKTAVQQLPAADAELLKAYLVRHAMAAAFGAGGIPEGTTFRKAINEQKDWAGQQQTKATEERVLAEKVAAEREAKANVIRDAVTVSVTGLQFEPSDWSQHHGNRFLVRVAFGNKKDKAIAGVKGVVHLADIFGDQLKEVPISFDKGLDPNGSAEATFEADYNQFIDNDKKLAQTPTEKVRVGWEPQMVIFEDGSKVASN